MSGQAVGYSCARAAASTGSWPISTAPVSLRCSASSVAAEPVELIHQADDPALCVEPGTGLEPGGHGAEQLTRREHEIAGLAAAGVPSREIVERLFLSIRTVDNHLQNVYAKLGITSREELARVLR
jgi:DNA-binding CsgD family transcriptional regulator